MDWPSQTLLGPAARLHLALFRFLPARVANLPCIQPALSSYILLDAADRLSCGRVLVRSARFM